MQLKQPKTLSFKQGLYTRHTFCPYRNSNIIREVISNRFTDEIQNKGHGYVEGEGIQVLEAGIDAKDIRQSGSGGILKDV